MNIREIRELIRVRPPARPGADRRLARCHDVAALRQAARRLIPRPVFDYVDGGSDEEVSLDGNVAAFRRWRFVPQALRDVSAVDTAGRVLGHPVPLPLVLAPAGFTGVMYPGGEILAARAAARHGLPYTLSTMATTSIADLAAAAPGDLWFQLYIMSDAGLTRELVDRAASKAGLPPGLVHSLAKAESGYNVAAVSRKGAIGLMQLMPGTAAELNADPRNPQQNADAGAKYLADLLVKYGGDVAKAVAAYNAGPGAVDKYNGVPPYPETRTYVNRVIRNYKQLGGE